MKTIAVLGAGFMGNAHIGGYRRNHSTNARYAAVCDNNREKCDAFAKEHGLRAYYDLGDMLAREPIDVVDICLPSHLHVDFSIKVAKAKRHILLEKPVAFTMEGARSIFAAARENGVRIMIAQVIRFWPEYQKIREIIQGGEIGDIVTVYAARLGQMPTWGEWYKDPKVSGETLFNLTIHDIDYLHYLFGEPESVYSAGTKDKMDNYNDVMNIFKFRNGANAIVDGSLSMTPGYPFTMHFRALGTKGTLEFLFKAGENIGPDSMGSLMRYLPGKGGEIVDVPKYDGYGREIEYFIDCLESGAETAICTQESVLLVLNSLLKAKESLLSGDRCKF